MNIFGKLMRLEALRIAYAVLGPLGFVCAEAGVDHFEDGYMTVHDQNGEVHVRNDKGGWIR